MTRARVVERFGTPAAAALVDCWLETGRTLNYLDSSDENRKMCSLYLSIMDRMGLELERFGDADHRLARL